MGNELDPGDAVRADSPELPFVGLEFPPDPRLPVPDPEAPNKRAVLFARLQHAIDTMPGKFALAKLDINNFRATNLIEGDEAGDELLDRTRGLLRTYVQEGYPDRQPDEVIAAGNTTHTSGDEYFVILFGVTTEKDLRAILDRIREKLLEAGIDMSGDGCIHRADQTVRDTYRAALRTLKLGKRRDRRDPTDGEWVELDGIFRKLGEMAMTVRDLDYYQEEWRERENQSEQEPEA